MVESLENVEIVMLLGRSVSRSRPFSQLTVDVSQSVQSSMLMRKQSGAMVLGSGLLPWFWGWDLQLSVL